MLQVKIYKTWCIVAIAKICFNLQFYRFIYACIIFCPVDHWFRDIVSSCPMLSQNCVKSFLAFMTLSRLPVALWLWPKLPHATLTLSPITPCFMTLSQVAPRFYDIVANRPMLYVIVLSCPIFVLTLGLDNKVTNNFYHETFEFPIFEQNLSIFDPNGPLGGHSP